MRADQPPALATKVLLRALPDTGYETLVGDLVEEYCHGRSASGSVG